MMSLTGCRQMMSMVRISGKMEQDNSRFHHDTRCNLKLELFIYGIFNIIFSDHS